jgi:hypothetical protein
METSRFEIDAELVAAEHEYMAAQKIFQLATERKNQAEISAAARLVKTALDQLARTRQQDRNV